MIKKYLYGTGINATLRKGLRFTFNRVYVNVSVPVLLFFGKLYFSNKGPTYPGRCKYLLQR